MIIAKSPLSETQLNIASEISQRLNLGIRLSKILVSRGIDSVEKAQKFLNCGKQNFYSPYLIKGIDVAKEKILSAVNSGKKILIFGDYDADGICASAIMYYTFSYLGVTVENFIPEREMGYGITEKSLNIILKKDIDLLITVDCGISCFAEIEILKNAGIEVIVTDHHELPEKLPDTTIVNCKIPSDYPYNNLCGAGVAYKLSKALIGDEADKLLDFVALATVADSMELNGENRDLVAEGLKLFYSPRPQFSAIMELSKVKEISSGMLAFTLAPKINACGRMGNANLGLKLMLSQDISEIHEISRRLLQYNIDRQAECETLYCDAISMLENKDLNTAVIVLYKKNWHNGLVGIVSAKIAEQFNRPTILFAKTDEGLKGSARSIEGVNFYQAIEACSEYLTGFGGHSQAAGVSIKEENLSAFTQALNKFICQNYSERFVKQTVVEEFITQPITIKEGKEFNRLEPYGTGNKKPLFAIKDSNFKINRLNGEHIAFKTNVIDMLYFNALNKAEDLASDRTKAVVFDLNYSVYNGKESIKGFVKNYEVVLQENQNDNLLIFQEYLNGLLIEPTPCKEVDSEEMNALIKDALKVPYGTIFAVSDAENLKEFPLLSHLPVEFSYAGDNTYLNKVIIGYKGGEYKNVLYLDRANAIVGGVKNITLKPFKQLGFDRNSVAEVFSAFNGVYTSVTDLIAKNSNFNAYQLVFAYSVLKELGIIKHREYIIKDNSVKNQITNSKIYNNFQNR